jgi:hypothetical protein
LKGTTTSWGMLDRSGGGVMYESVVDEENAPKPPGLPNPLGLLLPTGVPNFVVRFIVLRLVLRALQLLHRKRRRDFARTLPT